MEIAVTGASGFVGGAVCRAAVARGWTVRAYGRRPAVPAAHLGGAEYRAWDLAGAYPGVPPEVDAVVHCAGGVADWGPPREIWAGNLDGTRTARQTFPRARFVHVSTASVYDPFRPTVMAREVEAPVTRYLNAYGASKASAENLVRGDAVILRPHAIYGPGDTTLLPRLRRSIRGRRMYAVGDGSQPISLTHIDNLVDACLLAAEYEGIGVFNVTDAEPVLLDDALRGVLAELGSPARPYYLPARPALLLATLAEDVFRLARRADGPQLTRYAVSHLAVERTLDISAGRKMLGLEPKATSFAGIAGPVAVPGKG
ncbi:NAD-dependent epimerase/dehydratase family protein [Rhizohabitans arisaemae]|uniref:NAD-dependent epimerase/dehydratase family protein n=1 Tax=Rhizohabitans arisaemae TaxID=2720610 RepID=UPI0024B1AFB1|nr:NAD(P)-dependent oxidoreductase [Rhizohabitans arisaemae]